MVFKTQGPVHKCNDLTVHFLNKLCYDEPCPKLGTAKRNLFGYYESSEACQILDQQVLDMAKISRQVWNFDFMNESPESGRYSWQKVQSCDIPLWYAAVSRPALKDICRRIATNRDISEEIPRKSSSCPCAKPKTSPTKYKENDVRKNDQPPNKKPRLVQTTMKDYTRVKKRRSSCRLRLKQLQLFSHRLRSQHITADTRRTLEWIVLALCLLSACVLAEENRTDTTTEEEEAEFRQGLLSGYPAAYGAGNQFVSGTGGSGYVNMLRNLYRPPSLGLTDKVKHWVKSFMNRRQYVKPYYSPTNLQYSGDEFGAAGKPVFLGGNSYKAISVPLRQLQKYYKPYYPEQQASGSNSLLNYGLYAPSAAGLYGGSAGAGANSAFSAAASNSGTSQLFAGSDNLFSQGEGAASALFGPGGLYGAGGAQGSYQPPSTGTGSMYSLEGSQLYGSSDGSSHFFGASSSGSGSPSDLYASGSNPVANIYNPGNQGKKSSESALYMPDQRNAAKEAAAAAGSFSADSQRNSNGPQSSYSQFQGSSSGFQPVSFGS